MKKQYQHPEMEICMLDVEDCVRASFFNESKDNTAKDDTFVGSFTW